MKKLILLLTIIFVAHSCGIYKPTDTRKVPVNADERVKKNMQEGKGFRIAGLGGKGGDFLFSSSNPLWRASMEKLSFATFFIVFCSIFVFFVFRARIPLKKKVSWAPVVTTS